MSIFNKKPKQLTDADNFHKYTEDLVDLTKLREKAMQRAVLTNTEQAKQEVEQYDRMIVIAQMALLELSPEKGSNAS